MPSFFKWLIVFTFGFFLVRSFDLMILRGKYFRKLADENRIRKIILTPARGKIMDRNGENIALNSVKYFDENNKELGRNEGLKLESEGGKTKKFWVREYPLGKTLGHLTGYLSETSEEEIKNSKKCILFAGDTIGKSGVEQYYDCLLRGERGEQLVETGANGETIRVIAEKQAKAGEDLLLTIDSKWQKAVAESLESNIGAVVVLNPKNGEILALYSFPSFDPEIFTKKRDEAAINKLLNDQTFPFLNRAISGAFHPGSVFKPVVATAGLEEGKITAATEFEDTGVIKIGEWQFTNWYWTDYGKTEGQVNLVKAIRRSNDIYFYKAGEETGAKFILKWAKIFGFGKKTGIDLPAEINGFLPSPEWKEKAKGEKWFLGNTYHLSIGQGDLTVTPLQIAVETAVIANNGTKCTPHLNPNFCHSDAETSVEESLSCCQNLNIKPETINLIKQGMTEACSEGGTGFPFFNFNPKVACKTGTAEINVNTKDTQAWFTLFYPVDNPEIVITVLLERGGSGAYDAAPVAKKIIELVNSE